MVDDLVAAAEGRILVLEGMKGVRIGGDDAREAVLGQRGDVAPGESLERGFVAEAAGEIAAVELLLAEHGEVDAGPAQQLDERAQRALVAQIEGAVAEPQQHVGLALLRQDGEREIGGPVEPAGERAAAGIVGGAQLGQRVGGLAGRGPQLQRLEAAQIDHGVDMLDQHRTFVDAGAAGGAGPQRIRMDHGVDADEGQRAAAARLADGAAGMGVAGVAGIRSWAERVGEVLDQLLRIERLLGGEGGAGGLAAAALHAGVERQQLVPAKIAGRLAAELGGVERQRPQRGFPRPAGEAGGARMEGEMERAGEGVAHGADAHAREQLPAAPGADHQQARSRRSPASRSGARSPPAARWRGRRRRQRRRARRARARRRRPRAVSPRLPAPHGHHEGAERHDDAGEQQQAGEPFALEAEDMDEQDQQHGGDEAAGRQHMHLGRIAVARDDVMDVDQIAPRQLEEAQPVERRRATDEPAARAPERRPE